MPDPEYCAFCDQWGTDDETSARINAGNLVRRHHLGSLVHERCYAARAAQIITVRDWPNQAAKVRREYADMLATLPTYYSDPFIV